MSSMDVAASAPVRASTAGPLASRLVVEPALRSVYLRLRSAPAGTAAGTGSGHRVVAPGVVEQAVHWQRKVALELGPVDIESLGGMETVRERALGNIARLRTGAEVLVDTPDGGWFRVLSGDSPFLASRLLTLGALIRGEPGSSSHRGVLAAIPSAYEIGVHIIRDRRAPASIAGLAALARSGARAANEPLSPHVYWVTEGGFQQVTSWDAEGKLIVAGDAEFGALMDDMAAIGQIRAQVSGTGVRYARYTYPPYSDDDPPFSEWTDFDPGI